MGRKTVDDLIADLEKVLRVFRSKTPPLAIGDITDTALATQITSLRTKSTELENA